MPLSAEQVYNDLDGESVKEILVIRCADLLNQVPDFRSNIVLPRVRMVINIHLEVVGRTPEAIEIRDDLIVRMRDGVPSLPPVMHDLTATIDADPSSPTGQHPDEVRGEHGLPIIELRKGPFGNTEDVPVVHEDRIKYAFHVTQDYGPARARTGGEGPVIGGEVISQKNAGAAPDVGVNRSRINDASYQDRYDANDVNGQR